MWSDLIYNVCLTFITCVGTPVERVWEGEIIGYEEEDEERGVRGRWEDEAIILRRQQWRPRNIFSCLHLKAPIVRVLTSHSAAHLCFFWLRHQAIFLHLNPDLFCILPPLFSPPPLPYCISISHLCLSISLTMLIIKDRCSLSVGWDSGFWERDLTLPKGSHMWWW